MEGKFIFIELHDHHTGDEILINPKAIECVRGSKIYFHGYSVDVKESYLEIKRLIQEVGRYSRRNEALAYATGKIYR